MRVFLLALLLFFPETSSQGADRILSVCDVLANPKAFQGKTVRVRGIPTGGLEGAWLDGNSCSTPPVSLGGAVLVKAVSLTYQSSFGREVERKAQHIAQVEQELKKLTPRVAKNMPLTYDGVLETVDEWRLFKDGNGDMRIVGLGHDNGFPAQLVVTDLEDLQQHKTTSKANRERTAAGLKSQT